eukprot:scaffold50215_cov18-Tisochrysis_lutea.AAC.1
MRSFKESRVLWLDHPLVLNLQASQAAKILFSKSILLVADSQEYIDVLQDVRCDTSLELHAGSSACVC